MSAEELTPLIVVDERESALHDLLEDPEDIFSKTSKLPRRTPTPRRLRTKDLKTLQSRILRAAWFVEDVIHNEVQLRPQVLDASQITFAIVYLQRHFLRHMASLAIYGLIILSFLEKPGWMKSTPDWEYYPTYFNTWMYLDNSIVWPVEGVLLAVFTFCFSIKIYLIRAQVFNGSEAFALRLPLYIEMAGLAGALTEFVLILSLDSFSYTRLGHVFRITIFCARQPMVFNTWKLIFRLFPRILNVLLLVSLFLLFSSWCFWWIFIVAPGVGTGAFRTIDSSYYNLFQLLTTNNFPDIMMPFYDTNSSNSLLFIAFVIIGVFFLMNMVLSVIFFHYQDLNTEFQTSIQHLYKRNIRTAFRLLDITGSNRIGVEEMVLLLERMDMFRRMGTIQCVRVQKILYRLVPKEKELKDAHGEFISLEEFEAMIFVLAAEFENVGPQSYMETHHPDIYYTPFFQRLVKFVRGNEKAAIVVPEDYTSSQRTHSSRSTQFSIFQDIEEPPMSFIIDLVILTHLIVLLAAVVDSATQKHARIYELAENVFIEIYMVELLLKLFILGPLYYWRFVRNRVDGVLIISVFLALHFDIINAKYLHWLDIPSIQFFRVIQSLVSLRTVKLFRHLKMAPSFWNLMSSVDLVLDSVGTLLTVLFTFIYFSGTFGVSAFGGAICKLRVTDDGATFCEDYNGIPADSDFVKYDYFDNNFNDLPSALTVIFEIFVVNNVWVICDGIGIASGKVAATRAYFIFNYVFGTIFLLNIVLAVIITSTTEVYSKKTRRQRHITEASEPGFIGRRRVVSHDIPVHLSPQQSNLARELAFEFEQDFPDIRRPTNESVESYILAAYEEEGSHV